LFIIVICLLITKLSFSQNISFKQTGTIKQTADFIQSDILGNIYIITKNKIIKHNKNFEFQNSYTTNKTISTVDVSDPMKIIVFSYDFQLISILDNTLSETGNYINLLEIGIDKITLACNSHNKGIYLYNHFASRLFHLDFDNNITTQSQNINFNKEHSYNPDFVAARKKLVFLSDSSKGIIVFDKYCTYKKFIFLTSPLPICVEGDKIYFYSSNSIFSINYNHNLAVPEKFIDLEVTDVKSFYIINNSLYILTTNQINIYLITNN